MTVLAQQADGISIGDIMFQTMLLAADVDDAQGSLPVRVLLPQHERHHPLPARAVLQVVD